MSLTSSSIRIWTRNLQDHHVKHTIHETSLNPDEYQITCNVVTHHMQQSSARPHAYLFMWMSSAAVPTRPPPWCCWRLIIWPQRSGPPSERACRPSRPFPVSSSRCAPCPPVSCRGREDGKWIASKALYSCLTFKVTTNTSGAVRVRRLAQGHLDTSLGGAWGSNQQTSSC